MLPKIATPKYDMIVPSTGKSITYRPYVVKEEKILLIALESEDEKQIEKSIYSMIESCLDGKVNINDFTNFDIEFIFLTLRSMSVGEGIKLNIPCSSCEEPNEVSVDLNKLELSTFLLPVVEWQVAEESMKYELCLDCEYKEDNHNIIIF